MTGRRSSESAAPAAVERLDLSAHASSATLARRFIRQFAVHHKLRGEVVDQLVLVGCELVTNAVLHARTELRLTLELYPDRVRVAVEDQSSMPPARRKYRPEALTGRGLAMVQAVSRNWGADPAGAGKRIWADIERSPGQRRSAAAERPRSSPSRHRQPPDRRATRAVRFVGVPVKAYLELQQYNDALFREIELIGIALDVPGEPAAAEPDRLVALVERLRPMFRASSDEYREAVAAADARGEETVEIEVDVAPSLVTAARTYVDLLEEAETLSRSGQLLTPPPPTYVSSLRRWFVDQLAAQLLDGAAPRPPGADCLIS